MPSLTPIDKDRCRAHLGYDAVRGVPVAAAQRFEEAMDLIYSDYAYRGTDGIIYWLDRCDSYLKASNSVDGNGFTARQAIIGDVNRTTITLTQSDVKMQFDLYLDQTDQLAFKLNVPNFRRPGTARYLYERWGNNYVKAGPGFPDNCVSDRLYFAEHWM